MRADQLHVISVYSNPMRWQSRHGIFRKFIEHMVESGVKLTIVECGFGDRPFEWHDYETVQVVHVRSNSVNWTKENLINIGMSRLPMDWEYLAWVDGDIHFRHKHWASETVDALQQYPVIQPWADCYDLGPNGEHLEHHKSFACQRWHRKIKGIGPGYEFAHPGYAWASRRDILDKMGCLLDFCITGAADHHMALAMINRAAWSIPGGATDAYKLPILQWQERANKVIIGNLGYLPGSIEHSWHGRKKKRKYVERWQIIIQNKYDPFSDIKRNTWGVIELAGNKPQLAHDLDVYMHQRNEDGNEMD